MKYAPYSFSKLNTFFNCNKEFDYSYVHKIEIDREYSDPSFFKRGRFIHAYIADRLKGGKGLVKGYNDLDVNDKMQMIESADESLNNEFISLSFNFDTHGVEKSIKLNDVMKPIENGEYAINGFIDYYAVHDNFAMIVDWKSGKYRDTPSYDQLELYSIWLLEKHPELEEIDLVFHYVEHNKFEMKTITVDEIKKFKNNLLDKIKIIENTNTFEPNPSKQCLHCKFFNTCSEEFGFII